MGNLFTKAKVKAPAPQPHPLEALAAVSEQTSEMQQDEQQPEQAQPELQDDEMQAEQLADDGEESTEEHAMDDGGEDDAGEPQAQQPAGGGEDSSEDCAMDDAGEDDDTAAALAQAEPPPVHDDAFLIDGALVQRTALKPLRLLGKGDTCSVMEVVCPRSGKIFALKSMSKTETRDGDGDIEQTGITARTVNTELQALRALTDSPFACHLVGHTMSVDGVHLLMDVCQCDLFCLMKAAEDANRSLPAPQIQFIMAQVVEVLDDLHAHNFIYRDLKPENLLINSDGYVRLADFGSSFKQETANEQSKTVKGTPEYMAPEMIRHEFHSKAVDFWALGCLMYDIICQEPFADALDDAEVQAAVLQYAKTKKLKWKNGGKKVGASKNTKLLVSELLQPISTERLGMGAEGADEIRKHRYFANMDWSALRTKTLIVPSEWRPSPVLCSTDLTVARQEEEPAEAIRRMQNEYATLKEQYLAMQAQLSHGAGAGGTSAAAEAPICRKRLSDGATGEPSAASRRKSSSRRVSAPAPNAIEFESTSKPMTLDAAVTTPPNQQQQLRQLSALELFDF